MKKSHELRQVGTWKKADYDVGKEPLIVTSRSELRGDNTPANIGRAIPNRDVQKRERPGDKTQTDPLLARPGKHVPADKPWIMARDGAGARGGIQNSVPVTGAKSWTGSKAKVHKSWRKSGYSRETPSSGKSWSGGDWSY